MPKLFAFFYFAAVTFVILPAAFSAEDDEPVFSGPQVDEKLVPFTAEGVLADLAEKEIDLIKQADGGPVAIVFVHKLTRPSAAVTRAVMTYGAKFAKDGLVCGVVFLSDDATAAKAQIKRASHALPKVPIGVFSDGGEGPGAYGLNRKMTLTVLVGKDNKVTANFALVQPSLQADAPKIGHAIARVVGKNETPTLAQMGVKGQYTGNDPRTSRDPKFESLLRSLIQKTATEKEVDKIANELAEFVAKDAKSRQQLGEIARRIINAGKLKNYGTEPAQRYLEKWSKEFVAAPKPNSPPKPKEFP